MNTELIDILGRSLQTIGWTFLPLLLLPVLCLLYTKSKFTNRLQFTLIEIIDGVNMKIGEWVKWLLVALVVSVAFGVIGLSIFGQASTKFDESAVYFHASVILLGSAATLLAGQHVRVDIFHSKFSPKAKALVDIIGFYALLLPFCLALIWNSQGFISLAWSSFEGSAESDGIQGVFILKSFIAIFALMMIAQGFAIAGRGALILTGQPTPDYPKHIDPMFEPSHSESAL